MRPRTLFLSGSDRFLTGSRQRVVVPAPAAGAEWVVTVPGGHWWRPIAALFTFTTSAAVANRFPGVQISDPDGPIWRAQSPVAIAAGVSTSIALAVGDTPGVGAAQNGILPFILPRIWLSEQWTLGSITAARDAADQYSGFRLWVEEITEPTDNIPAGGTLLEAALESADTAWLREQRP